MTQAVKDAYREHRLSRAPGLPDWDDLTPAYREAFEAVAAVAAGAAITRTLADMERAMSDAADAKCAALDDDPAIKAQKRRWTR